MLFKGTARRTSKEIAEEVEGRGGMLNAFTDKEQTCYYCRLLSDDVSVGIDVLCDMLTNSLIDPGDLSKEQGVVVEEIKRSEDEPSDHVHELHLSGRWGDHPLGKPIIGTRESVSGFGTNDLHSYMQRRYTGENVLLAISGNVVPEVVFEQANELLSSLPSSSISDSELVRPQGQAARREISKEIEQVHFCIGTDGASLFDEDLFTVAVLDAILGGGMSSRLFQEIREKRGLAYAIGSYALSYDAGGAYTVYGGTSLATWVQVEELVRAEFDKISKELVQDEELARSKRNICGHLVLALEGMSSRMMRMAKNELHYGRQIPVDETISRINAVSQENILEAAARMLDADRVSITALGPFLR